MAVNIGPKIGIDGEAKYRSQINAIIQQAKTLEAEMKAVTSAFNANTSAEQKNASTAKVLAQQIQVQQQRVQKLTEMLQKSAQKYGENDTKTLKWRQAVLEATAALNKMQNEADGTADATEDVGNAMDDASKQALSFGDVLKANVLSDAITSGLRAIAEGFKTIASTALGYNATMEGYQTSFEVMMGSAEKAKKIVAELTDFAAKTPFEMRDLADTTQLLMNYGLTADQAMERMSMLGDIAQGNAEKMNRIAIAYGQMSSAGKVQLEDIKQMIEAGFNPLQEISQTTGESMQSLYDRISAGTISVDEITAAMQRSTAEGGKYFQSMEKQSQTLNGQLSTLKDNASQALGTMFQGVSESLTTTVLPQINEALQSIDVEAVGQKITTVFNQIVAAVTPLIPVLESVVNFVVNNFPLIASVIAGAGVAQLILGIASAVMVLTVAISTNPIGAIVTAIVAVVAALATWISMNDNIKQSLAEGLAEIQGWVESVKQWFLGLNDWLNLTLGTFFNVTLRGMMDQLEAFIVEKFEAIKQFFSDLWTGIQEMAVNFGNGIITTIGNVKDAIISGITAAVNFIKSLPEQAFSWGADMIQGLINGIKSIDIGAAIGDVANSIASFLHFSRPDVGPLRDYETWMPDFMAGLARTIRASEHLVTGAVQDVANNMSMAMRPAGATVRLENVAFYGYTPEQGTRFVNDLNRKLGRLL